MSILMKVVIGIIIIAVVLFAIFQPTFSPFVQGWLAERGLPMMQPQAGNGANLQTIATLMTFIVAILALGVTASGFLLRSLLQKTLDDKIEELTDMSKARTSIAHSFMYEKLHESLWSQNNYSRKSEGEQWFQELAQGARDYAMLAIDLIEKYSNELPRELQIAKNNLAYQLGTLQQDKSKAQNIAEELKGAIKADYHDQETIAWVLMRFAELEDNNFNEGLKIVKSLVKDR